MPKITLEQLGQELKRRRGYRGIRTVAKEIGVSAATLSRLECGKQPDLDTFTKLCKWLEVDPGEVLGYKVAKESVGSAQDNSFPSVMFQYRAPQTMKAETAKHLGELILSVQRALNNEFNG